MSSIPSVHENNHESDHDLMVRQETKKNGILKAFLAFIPYNRLHVEIETKYVNCIRIQILSFVSAPNRLLSHHYDMPTNRSTVVLKISTVGTTASGDDDGLNQLITRCIASGSEKYKKYLEN